MDSYPAALVVGVVLLVGFAILYMVSLYNNLQQVRQNIDKAFSNISVLLQQRCRLLCDTQDNFGLGDASRSRRAPGRMTRIQRDETSAERSFGVDHRRTADFQQQVGAFPPRPVSPDCVRKRHLNNGFVFGGLLKLNRRNKRIGASVLDPVHIGGNTVQADSQLTRRFVYPVRNPSR